MMEYNLQPYGHRAWLLSFNTQEFSKILCLNILRLAGMFQRHNTLWQEIVPAYDSLLLKSGPDISRGAAQDHIHHTLSEFTPQQSITPPSRIIDIPVYYGGQDGPDLEYVAETCGLSLAHIIERHSAHPYLVCLMGFIPGFAFMSETDPALHIPRHKTPRAHVPEGSVGLAGWQTGIYGLSSPGGWQIIGRTPLRLFNPRRDAPFLLKAGDWARFVPKIS